MRLASYRFFGMGSDKAKLMLVCLVAAIGVSGLVAQPMKKGASSDGVKQNVAKGKVVAKVQPRQPGGAEVNPRLESNKQTLPGLRPERVVQAETEPNKEAKVKSTETVVTSKEERSAEEETENTKISTSESVESLEAMAAKPGKYDALLRSLLTRTTQDKGTRDSKEVVDSKRKSSSEEKSPNLIKDLLDSVKEKLEKRRKAVDITSSATSKTSTSNPTMITTLPSTTTIPTLPTATTSRPVQQRRGSSGKLPLSYRLKNIRSLITPELLFSLAQAGEGDHIVLAANGFPSARLVTENKERLIHLDGLSIASILKEIMKLITVCKKAKFPLLLMKPENDGKDPKVWSEFKDIVERADDHEYQWAKLSKPKFWEEAGKAIAIIQTGDENPSASLIITLGKIEPPRKEKNKRAEDQTPLQRNDKEIHDPNEKDLEMLRAIDDIVFHKADTEPNSVAGHKEGLLDKLKAADDIVIERADDVGPEKEKIEADFESLRHRIMALDNKATNQDKKLVLQKAKETIL